MNKLNYILLFLLLLCLVALGVIGNNYIQKNIIAQTYLEEKLDLNSEFEAVLEQMEDLESKSKKLQDSLAVEQTNTLQQKTENQELKTQIENLIQKERLTQKELLKAKNLIEQLKTINLQTNIEQMKVVVSRLENDVSAKNENIISLNNQLSGVQSRVNRLQQKVQEQVKENNNLKSTLREKEPKIIYSELAPISYLEIKGVKVKKSGSTKEKTNTKRVDQLVINFTMSTSEFAEAGNKKIYIRIITPEGNVAYNEMDGSGVFVAANNQEMRYTKTVSILYDNKIKTVETSWTQSQNFQEGTYTVELYEEGFLRASSTLELK